MKNKLIFIVIVFFCTSFYTNSVFADVYVEGYFRSDGTYVESHYRSAPDGEFNNNWSTEGNVNPYTGKEGTKQRHSDWNSNTVYYNGQYYAIEEDSDEFTFYDYLWFGILGFYFICILKSKFTK